ncbi:alpha/beta hydrolase [Ornithinibacillus halophilus]|uniref:Lysophospholipase, alpha-beta hydrolase superfamily n=1 Tax=Ornithinibacillus halophilus TaxID=930117 RepID=A0A1M5J9V7_9BACI|nr:alpha/beta hydrolase [Ornithinibacillus halophilus]SHG37376.1 Lysophospholipase, alpha-beta hydrolase superfamily [Ornithinibacillus halophilus]
MEEITLTAKDGLELSVALCEAKKTRALVQLIHGANEHKGRYYNFMEFLRESGFSVIISDNRGHGASINEQYPLGYMNGVEEIIADQLLVTNYMKNRFPNKDLYLFGHSLGSLFARCYLQEHDDKIQKLVMSGTANYVRGVWAGILLGKLVTLFSGKHGYSKILSNLSGNNNDDSWLSASQTNIENYRNDPLCQYDYQNGAQLTVFMADYNLQRYHKYECKNPSLPILSVVGEGDPITGGEKGLKDSFASLRKIGYQNITSIVYPGMKHEVLNEDDNELVYKDILEFLLGG